MIVVSGGQTGVDRAALDVARELGLERGGWCPAGGWAEDHPEPPGLLVPYPELRPTPSADPAERTAWNVRDSDATLVFVPPGSAESPGTGLTADIAVALGRPLLEAVDATEVRPWLTELLATKPSLVLNVAGPRESELPGAYELARAALTELLGPYTPAPAP